jgi:uncharacterized membrane protein
MKTARIERILGIVLLSGVLSSAVFVLAGGAVYMTHHGTQRAHYRIFRGEPSDLRSLQGVLGDAREFSGRGIILLGLMFLVAVQVIRVGLTCLLFAWNRDRVFVMISLLVLVMLLYGILIEGR